MAMDGVVLPGQVLGSQSALMAGEGTYVRDGDICASILGVVSIVNGKATVTRKEKAVGSAQVLSLDDIVLCKISKVTTRQLLVDIICVRDTVLQESFPGTIRLEDVRMHDIDKLELEKLFKPGMLIKAAVLSYGDTRSYFLSTAKPGLGIVQAAPQKTA